MTVYSGTFTPQAAVGKPDAFRDPLSDAREKLRLAARLPFHAARPNAWQESFHDLTTDARAAIRRHVWLAGLADSPLNAVEDVQPRLSFRVGIQRSEHDIFLSEIDDLLAAADDETPVDIWKMIELGERAILLEMALARHHNRLSWLLFEAMYVEIGTSG
ncbi:MAG: hypothetical protein IPI85_02465 [Dehalococcoidia bacterium]|nr:hypothetical protein [Dehalococcoidia bacterium]